MSALELKVPPPIVALVLALLMWLTPAVAGLVQIPDPARVLCAVVLVCAGQGISIAGMVVFRRAKTTVNPVKASLASSLVIRGVYRYTRNPMYVGLLLTLLAGSVSGESACCPVGCRVRALHHSVPNHPGRTCIGVSIWGRVRGLQRQGTQMGMRPNGSASTLPRSSRLPLTSLPAAMVSITPPLASI